MALLEVIVAIAILATAGVSAVTVMAESFRAIERVRASDAELARGSALFDAVALWTRDDLDRHLGSRRQGPWRMTVERAVPTLYEITLTDSTGARELLRTSLYRPPTPEGGSR